MQNAMTSNCLLKVVELNQRATSTLAHTRKKYVIYLTQLLLLVIIHPQLSLIIKFKPLAFCEFQLS